MNRNSSDFNPYAVQSFSYTLLINMCRIFFGFCSLAGNGFILYTIGRFASVRRNLCNLLIGLLAFADFWAGIGLFFGSWVIVFFQLIPWYNYTTGICLIIQYTALSGIQMSQIATIFIAFDRLKAVQDPLQYYVQNRTKQFSLALSVTILYSLIATAFIFAGIDFNSYPCPTFCNAGSVLHHYFIIYWQLFAIVVAITVIVCYVTTSRTLTKKLLIASNERLNRELTKQQAVFKTIKIVLVMYGLCWCLPNAIVLIATLMGAGPELLGMLTPIIAMGTGICMSSNVVVYAWKHHELRAAMRSTFSRNKTTRIINKF